MKLLKAAGIIMTIGFSSSSYATLIDFTGGTVTQLNGSTSVTNSSTQYDNVDFYEEDGVKFDFLGASGNAFSYHIGDYYNVGNDVIHGHWAGSGFGDMTSIFVNKLNGASFDLNYLKITTNTFQGGSAASGAEEVFINALADGSNISYSMMLPPDDWGFSGPNSEIFFGSEFDNILAFSVTFGANAKGLGLDEFFIDEENVPAPPQALLIGLGLIGLIGVRKQLSVQSTSTKLSM